MTTLRTLAVLAALGATYQVQAATITDPIPYVQLSDTPDDFFDHDPTSLRCIQDFENPDGGWETGFTIDTGMRIGPNFESGVGPATDSVDADDGTIDGDGRMGSSWFTEGRVLTVVLDDPTSAASFVFTDTDTQATSITITAWAKDGTELVNRVFDTSFVDDVYTGTTGEDRFFGIKAEGDESIKRFRVRTDLGGGIEIDHIQFLKPVPEPTSYLILLTAALCFGGFRRCIDRRACPR